MNMQGRMIHAVCVLALFSSTQAFGQRCHDDRASLAPRANEIAARLRGISDSCSSSAVSLLQQRIELGEEIRSLDSALASECRRANSDVIANDANELADCIVARGSLEDCAKGAK
jgi:hypothetical protein